MMGKVVVVVVVMVDCARDGLLLRDDSVDADERVDALSVDESDAT